MNLPEHFRQYLVRIRPTQRQKEDARDAHRRLRDKLTTDVPLDEHVLTTFLQGSYRRSTDIRPIGNKKSDVDIVVVTNMSEDRFLPAAALGEFRPFLEEHYKGCYEQQDRSWGIVDGEVELDLVPTSAPTEVVQETFRRARESDAAFEPGIEQYGAFRKALSLAKTFKEAALAKGDQWKEDPLRIPDRARLEWRDTHPLIQIDWTVGKNQACKGHYVDVVRAVKWTHLDRAGDAHPKGYPLEALVGVHCPDGIDSVAEGVVKVMESIVSREKRANKPRVTDHGVNQDVFQRVTLDQWAAFYDLMIELAPKTRAAYDEPDRSRSAKLWKEALGSAFPDDTDGNDRGFRQPSAPPASAGPERRFA